MNYYVSTEKAQSKEDAIKVAIQELDKSGYQEDGYGEFYYQENPNKKGSIWQIYKDDGNGGGSVEWTADTARIEHTPSGDKWLVIFFC